MSASRRYAIIGTGAIGGYYGARLQQSGCEVHFLLRSDYAHVRQHGLRIDSVAGDFILPQVKAYADPADIPPVDVIIIALKTTQNHRLADLLPPLLPATAILTLQNGLGIEAEIAHHCPNQPILGGLCFICSNKVGPGQIRHLDYGQILLGAYDASEQPAGITAAMTAIAQDFKKAQIPTDLTTDLFMARWRKLVWNVPYNGLSVVLNATTDELMAHPDTRALVESLMGEVITAANAWGKHRSPRQNRALPWSFITEMLATTDQMQPYRTSMKLDYDEGRPLEIEAILSKPVRAALELGIAVPQMQMLYQQLCFLDSLSLERGSIAP